MFSIEVVILLWGVCRWSSKAGGIRYNLPELVGFIALNPLQSRFCYCFGFFTKLESDGGKRNSFGQKDEKFQQDLNDYVLV